jgi:hypothetical protein
MAGKEIIVTNGYFNNIRLFGGSTAFPALAKAKRDDPPPYTPTYGLKLFFAQWDETGHPVEGNIGNFTGTEPEPIPQVPNRFDITPVVFSPGDISGKTLLQVISEVLPINAGGDITEPEFQGYDPGDPDANPPVPPSNPVDSPYLMSLTLGVESPVDTRVRYEGHEDTKYEFEDDGTIKIHWEGESWMYYVGVPNPTIMIDENVPSQGDPEYPSYPTRLIYQFVFRAPQTPAGTPPAYPGTDGGDGDTSTNKWITTSKLIPGSDDDSPLYLPITLSWERLEFNYIYGVREVNGIKRQVGIIKDLKRLGR